MKILQLITQNQLRGAEVFAAQLSDMLVELGHEVVLASILGGEQVLSTRPEVRQVSLGGSKPARGLISLRTWWNLRRLAGEFEPDVVQANGSETLKYGVLLRFTKRSLPVVYRNISVMSMWSGSRFKRLLIAAALRRMSHVASVTKVGKTDLVGVFGLLAERVSVVPIGVRETPESSAEELARARANIRQRFGLPADALVVVHVGSYTPEKNHAGLLEAFARVVRKVPTARLLLLGDGPLREQVEATISDLDLATSVHLAGVVPDAADLMVAAELLTLPSLREGLPGVLLEAGVAGIPVVAYDVGGVCEVVEDGATGALVAQGDIGGLVDQMVRLLLDPGLRSAWGEAARARIVSQYALQSVATQFQSLYGSLLE